MHRYIVVVSPAYGGAEKRFFDIYTALRRQGRDVFYIAPSTLLNLLRADHPERQDVFDGLVAVPLASWSVAKFVWRYLRLLRTLPRGSVFHYPMNCLWPLHLGRGDTLTMSFVDCKRVPRLFSDNRSTTMSFIAFRIVRKIDVLHPGVFDFVRRSRVGRKVSLTPGGTFLLPPVDVGPAKPPVVVFLGRLIEDKGILDLLRVVPGLWRELEGRAPAGFELVIAGYGQLEREVARIVDELAASGIPIRFIGYARAPDVMRAAAVVLSLQQETNYPSRVVAEALASGCAVIVRDTGDSRSFGELPGLSYCAEPLEVGELSAAILASISQASGAPNFASETRAAAVARFTNPDYLRYFDELLATRRTEA